MDRESTIENNSVRNQTKFPAGVLGILLLQLLRNKDNRKENVIPDLLKYRDIRKDIQNIKHLADPHHDIG